MLSVIIPTEGVEQPAVATLAALVPGAASGLVREVVLPHLFVDLLLLDLPALRSPVSLAGSARPLQRHGASFHLPSFENPTPVAQPPRTSIEPQMLPFRLSARMENTPHAGGR